MPMDEQYPLVPSQKDFSFTRGRKKISKLCVLQNKSCKTKISAIKISLSAIKTKPLCSQ